MAIVGFEQHPDGPPGLGTFHFDDRPSLPAYSPKDAAPFMGAATAPEQEPDQRLAMSNPGDVYKSPSWQGAQPAALTPEQQNAARPGWFNAAFEKHPMDDDGRNVADVGPNMSPAPPEPAFSAAPPNASVTPPMSAHGQAPAPAPMAPVAPQAPPIRPPVQGQPMPGTAGPAAPRGPDPGIPAPLRGAPRGMQAASQVKTIEGAGRPVDPEEARQRSDAAINQALVEQEIAANASTQQAAMALAAGKRAEAMQQRVAQETQRRDQIKADYAAKRQSIQSEVDAAGRREVDPNHLFEGSTGAFGRIVAMLGQAIGAYAATLGRTPNFAQKIVDDAIERDIAAQRDNIAKQGMHAQNKLSQIMRDYDLDVGEASAILKNSQQQLADQQAMAFAHATKSQETIDNYNKWYAQRQVDREAEERKIADNAYGKASAKIEYKRQSDGAAGAAKYDGFSRQLGYPDGRSMLADYVAKQRANPDITWNEFVSQGRQAMSGRGGGSGSGGARLGMAAERAGLGAKALDELEHAYDSGADRGYLSGKLAALGNSLGGTFGTGDSAKREATKKGATAEVAAALAGGSPTDTMLHEIGSALDTNDPNRIKAAINHYRGMLKEAERRYVSRAGRGTYVDEGGTDDNAEFEAEAK